MGTVSNIADNYIALYGFMAVNATMRHAAMLHRVHDIWTPEELRLIHDELLRRGYRVISTKEEYLAGVAEHGPPLAFWEKPPA